MNSPITPLSPLPAQKKMPKKEKTIIWVGAGMVLFALLFALFFLALPNMLAAKDQCQLALGGDACSYTWMVVVGLPAFFAVGIPLIVVGLTLMLWAVLRWKKIKNPGLTAFLAIALLVVLLAVILLLLRPLRWSVV